MKSIHTITLAASLLATAASADDLLRYDTAGSLAGATSITNSAAAVSNLITGALTASASLSENKAPNSFAPWGWTQSTPAAALANSEYLTFTVSADSQHQLNLGTLELVFFVQNVANNNPDWAIYSSADNFTTPLGSGTNLPGGTYTHASIDVGGTEFDAVQGNLEFRIAMGNALSEWHYAGVSTDNNSGEWPKPAAIELTGVVEEKVDPIEPELILPPTLVDSAEVYHLVVHSADGVPSTLYPVGTQDLISDPWAGAAHSGSPFGPFVVTNLDYATINQSGDYSIYLEIDAPSQEFFGIEYRY